MSEIRSIEKNSISNNEKEKLVESLTSLKTLLDEKKYDQINTIADSIDLLVVPFLEKPQLLDKFIKPYISYILNIIQVMCKSTPNEIDITLMDNLFNIVYSIIRVRGWKTAVMYFPNDVYLLTPILHILKRYDETDLSKWKSQYILIFWLRLLLLSPFDLSYIEESNESITSDIYSISLLYLPRSDSVGEMASLLLSQLISRRDVIHQYLQPSLQFYLSTFQNPSSSLCYNAISSLSALLKHVQIIDIRPYYQQIQNDFVPICSQLLETPNVGNLMKINLLKLICHITTVYLQCLYLNSNIKVYDGMFFSMMIRASSPSCYYHSNTMDNVLLSDDDMIILSNTIEIYMTAITLNSLQLREKASKYFAKLCFYLPSDLFLTVYNEILLIIQDELNESSIHGGLFTIASLLSYHIIPSSLLSSLIDSIQAYLLYHIQITSSSSLVRETTCYILWCIVHYYHISLAAVTTSVMSTSTSSTSVMSTSSTSVIPTSTSSPTSSVIPTSTSSPTPSTSSSSSSLTSLLSSLILLSLTDNHINTRRAAAAVIQEIIGRSSVDIPHGLQLLAILSYTALGNIQYTYYLWNSINHRYCALLPKIVQFSEYQDCLLHHIKWIAENQDDFSIIELAAKSLFYIATKIPSILVKHIIEPILASDWSKLPRLVTNGYIHYLAQIIGGLIIAKSSLSQHQWEQIITLLMTPKMAYSRGSIALQTRSSYLLLLKNVLLYYQQKQWESLSSDLLNNLIKQYYPLNTNRKWNTRDLNYSIEEGCLWLLSECIYETNDEEGKVYCSQLADKMLQMGTEYSIHLVGSIWIECTQTKIPQMVDCLSKPYPSEVLECLTTIIGRLYWFTNETPASVLKWVQLGCNCYKRDIRGDIGSWTRKATLLNLKEILLKWVFSNFLKDTYNKSICINSTEIITNYGNAHVTGDLALEYQFASYLPFTSGCLLFPDGKQLIEVLPTAHGDITTIDDTNFINQLTLILLKQLCEQHAIIREEAYQCLSILLRSSSSSLSLIHVLEPILTSPYSSTTTLYQCINLITNPSFLPTVLRGILFVIGGNTPVITEECSKRLVLLCTDVNLNKAILSELILILNSKQTWHQNGFYPALKTFLLCSESCEITEILTKQQLGELQQFVYSGCKQYKTKVAVIKSLLDLQQQLLSMYTSPAEVIRVMMSFLSCSYSYIREEAAQALYMYFMMNPSEEKIDEEACDIVSNGLFSSKDYETSCNQLKELYHLYKCLLYILVMYVIVLCSL